MIRVWITLLVVAFPLFASNRSLVDSASKHNHAVLVGAPNGLSGIDIDVENIDQIVRRSEYKFDVDRLEDANALPSPVTASIERAARNVGKDGTLLFYFSGHGGHGTILLSDYNTYDVKDLKAALESGRTGLGKIERLALIFDSCYSGSFLDLFRMRLGIQIPTGSADFADEVVRSLAPSRGEAALWNKLFVFASSRADETSLAGSNGSVFTVAFKKAFEEAADAHSDMKNFVELTQKYTVGHHPVAKLVPDSLWTEPLLGH